MPISVRKNKKSDKADIKSFISVHASSIVRPSSWPRMAARASDAAPQAIDVEMIVLPSNANLLIGFLRHLYISC